MTDAAKMNYTSGNQTLNESDTLNPTCVADGNPTPNITWTRVSDNKAVSFPFIISGKQDEGGYECTASNGVRSPDSRIVYVFVQSKLILNCFPVFLRLNRVTKSLSWQLYPIIQLFSVISIFQKKKENNTSE